MTRWKLSLKIRMILIGFVMIGGFALLLDTGMADTAPEKNTYEYYQFDEFGFQVAVPTTWKQHPPEPQDGADAVAVFTKPGQHPKEYTAKLTLRHRYQTSIGDQFGSYQSDVILRYEAEHPRAQSRIVESKQFFLLVSNNKNQVSDVADSVADIQGVYVGQDDVVILDFDLPYPTYQQVESDVYRIMERGRFQSGYGPGYEKSYDHPSSDMDEDMGEWIELILDLIGLMFQLGFFVVLLIVGYFVGRLEEGKHFKKIRYREQITAHQPVITSKLQYALSPSDQEKIANCVLVCGSMVVSEDYFKRILAALKCFFGGQIASFETLLDRARREAILRMKAQQPHADMYINVRTETSSIGQGRVNKNDVSSIEVLAYGTAVFFKQGQSPLKQNYQDMVEANAAASLGGPPRR